MGLRFGVSGEIFGFSKNVWRFWRFCSESPELAVRTLTTAVCTNPTLTRAEFYDVLMMKFGVQCDSTLKSRQLAALEENIRRLTAAGRADLLKLTNSDVLRNVRANYPLYRPADLPCIKLGVSAMSAQEGAAALYGCITRAAASMPAICRAHWGEPRQAQFQNRASCKVCGFPAPAHLDPGPRCSHVLR